MVRDVAVTDDKDAFPVQKRAKDVVRALNQFASDGNAVGKRPGDRRSGGTHNAMACVTARVCHGAQHRRCG